VSGTRLSALEASYLCFERPGRPVHVGALAVFEGGPLLDEAGKLRLDAIRAHVASRVPLLPRLRQRLVTPRLGIDRPRWVDDPGFDVADHVTEVRLPAPGDDAALRAVAEELHVAPLDHRRPPWDIHLVTGLAGGRVALVERAHHALVDGVGGVDLAAVLLDLDPAGPAPAAPGAGPATGEATGDDEGHRPLPIRVLARLAAARPTLGHVPSPLAALHDAGRLVGALAALVDEGVTAPRTSLDVHAGTRRRLAWVGTPLDEVSAVGHATGTTVNDVVLAAVTAGLRALLVERGEPVPHDLVLKAMVPVSERDVRGDGALGNQVAAVMAPLPVGVASPTARLELVGAAMRRLKARRESGGVHAALRAADLLPMPLVSALVHGLDHQRFVNLVVTNVPGPPVPLYLLGARMLEAVPMVPLTANMSLGVAVLSYDGTLRICVNADADACPDVEVVTEAIERDLSRLAGEATA
jgi:WS/DGAT/MGAT family acyltransferase